MLVASVPHWHHAFEIYPGVFTPGSYDPQFLLDEMKLPDNLCGMSVLDIGTADGFFALRLAQRGARVVAIDYRKKEDHGFHVMEKLNDVNIEYHQMNIYDSELASLGKFDFVIFMGILYHLPDLWRALHIARSCCQGTIFIESQVELDCDPSAPLARYYPGNTLASDHTNYWLPNRRCLLELLHDCGFDMERETAWANRMFITARSVTTHGIRAEKMRLSYDVLDGAPRRESARPRAASPVIPEGPETRAQMAKPAVADETVRALPPPKLRYKVAGTDNANWFEASGQMSIQDLTRALASIGRSLDEFPDVLEWGCGCGRILRHMPTPQPPRTLHGNDIDAEAIGWVNDNLPWVKTSLTTGLPPLPYPDDSFDLIFNHSVMTHLDATYQDAWLAELRRVLRPGGIVTLTVSGPHASTEYFNTLPPDSDILKAQKKQLLSDGILYISQDQWGADFPDFYHSTFNTPEYIFDHWSEFLLVRSYIPRGALNYQDMVVLQNGKT